MRTHSSRSDRERFMEKVRVPEDRADCWNWIASTEDGYGRFRLGSRVHRAHRVAYELFVGPIPKGRVLDHVCRNRSCVNPDHLEVVTAKRNTLRGTTAPAQNAHKTVCPRGHAYDSENTYWWKGERYCRACHRARVRARRAQTA